MFVSGVYYVFVMSELRLQWSNINQMSNHWSNNNRHIYLYMLFFTVKLFVCDISVIQIYWQLQMMAKVATNGLKCKWLKVYGKSKIAETKPECKVNIAQVA